MPLTALFFLICSQQYTCVIGLKTMNLSILAMVPPHTQNNCIKDAIQLASDDVNRMSFMESVNENGTIITYKFKPVFLHTSPDPIKSLADLNEIIQEKPMKYAVLGTPFADQNKYTAKLVDAYRITHITYSEMHELLRTQKFFAHAIPSIVTRVYALKALLSLYDWTKIGLLVDYSERKYNEISRTLRKLIESNDKVSKEIHISDDQAIWKQPPLRNLSKELSSLQRKGVRISVLLSSIGGARKVLCEAFQRNMYGKKFIWIMFEKLPDGWASSKYDAYETPIGMKREINCTEDELLIAADRYISITEQGLRRDGKSNIGNLTADYFRTRLDSKQPTCDMNMAAYAYDSVWILAMAFNLSQFDASKYVFRDPTGYAYKTAISKGINKLHFQGITGSIMYRDLKHYSLPPAALRDGPNIILCHKKKNGPVYIGTHDAQTLKLQTVPNVNTILFDDHLIPKDGPSSYISEYENIHAGLLYTMWGISICGILLSITLLLIIIFHKKSDNELVFDTPCVDSLLCTGATLCYLSVIVNGIDTTLVNADETFAHACTIFVCLLSVGYTLCFGALFTKTWKIYKIHIVAVNKVEPKTATDTEVSFL